jgi:hypothetical protein
MKIEDPSGLRDLIARCNLAEATKEKVEALLARRTTELAESRRISEKLRPPVADPAPAAPRLPDSALLSSTLARHGVLEAQKKQTRRAIKSLESQGRTEDASQRRAQLAELEQTQVELVTLAATNRQLGWAELLEMEQKTRGRQTRAMLENDQATVSACRKELTRLRKLRDQFIAR